MQVDEVLNNQKNSMIRMTASIFFIDLFNILVNNVDQLMISHYSQTAVAAVGNANQISWVLMLLLTVLSNATVILVTQYKGAKSEELVKKTYAVALVSNIILGIVLGLVFIFFGRGIFAIMNVKDPEILNYAYEYIAITGGGTVFMALIMSYSAFFRSNAMMKEALIITIIVNVLNIIGNWLLIYGVGPFPELGVIGVAVSTVAARAIGTILLIIVFRKKIGRIEFKLLKPFPKEQLKKLLRIGVPSTGENFSYDAAQLVIMGFINAMGLVAVNSKIYVYLVVQAAYLFTSSLSEAMQVTEGYLLGAKRHDEANKRVMRSLALGIVVSAVLTTLIWVFSDQIIGLFLSGTDPNIIELRAEILSLCKTILMIDIILESGRAINFIMVRALQTAGDIKFPVIMCIIFSWFFSVGCGYILGVALGYGLAGIWIGMMLDECLRGVVLSIRWKRGGWRKIDLVSEKEFEAIQAE